MIELYAIVAGLKAVNWTMVVTLTTVVVQCVLAWRRSRLEIKKLQHDTEEWRIVSASHDDVARYDPKTKAVVDAAKMDR
ncbi:MAG: hypothetical protein ABSH14_14475 [Verrucomicrobiia bacterium]|jgi:hypothetical protein